MTATYRAEHVGSLLRPPELLDARVSYQQGRITLERLRELEDAAALAALELQRQAGIEVFTDGEVRRESWLASVMESVGGLVDVDTTLINEAEWHRNGGKRPTKEETSISAVVVGEKLHRKAPVSGVEAAFLAANAPGRFKITMASASMGSMLWDPAVSERAYAGMDEMVADFVKLERQEIEDLLAAGVTWIQLDSLMYLQVIDDDLRAQAGDVDPAAVLDVAVNVDNTLIRAARAANPRVTVGMHFCRGNNRSAWVGKGGYDAVAERMFGDVETDRFLLEYDTERAGGFEPLRFVPPGKTVVLGLVSTKTPVLESSDDLRRRIEQASKYLPLEQLALGAQCGFASTAKGNLLTVDDQRRKLELVVETAQRVWG